MKKISLFLVIAIIMSLFQCFAFTVGAENQVVHSNKFSEGATLPISYSDQPDSGFVIGDHTGFANIGGKLVFDTAPQITAGTVYPYKSTTQPAYPRANYGGTIEDARTAKYLYQTEIKFDRAFFAGTFVLRYGASNWVNNVTNDVTLYEFTDTGLLRFGSESLQLTLGETYKIAVLTDLTNGTNYYRHLYVNGELKFQNQTTTIGGSEGATPAKVFGISHVLRPYNSPYPFSYKDTKLTLGDIIVSKITDEYIISGDDTAYIMPDSDKTYQYSCRDMFSSAVTPTWSVAPTGAGVDISASGLLSVTSSATAGDYVISAVTGGKTVSKTVKLEAFSYIYTITGDTSIVIVPGGGTKQYTYECKDQLLAPANCNFSILEAMGGLTITDEGVLSVPETATAGAYTVIAKDKLSSTELARLIINISRISYSISGSERLFYPIDGSLSMVKYKVIDNLGVTNSAALFKINGAAVMGVTVQPDGTVYFDGTVTAASFQLAATLGETTLTKNVTLATGRFMNFEADVVGSKPIGWDQARAAVIAEVNGNKFVNGLSTSAGRLYLGSNMGYSVTTLKFKTMMRAENSASANMLDLGASTKGTDTGAWYMPLQAAKTGSDYTVRTSYSPDILATTAIDNWVEVKIIFDYDSYKFDLYINDQLKLNDISLPSDATNYRLEGVFTSSAMDDLSIYSGEAVSRDISIATAENIFLPEAGSVRETTLKANVTINGQVVKNAAVEWSMASPYAGVTLAGDKLTVSDSATGSFSLTAKIPGTNISDTKTFNLIVPDVFPSISGSQLSVNSTPNTVINISIFGTLSTLTLADRFGYEFSTTETLTTTITTDANGRGVYSLSSLSAGRYNIQVFKTGSAVQNLPYVSKPEELLSDTAAMGTDEFKDYLKEFSTMSDADIDASCNTYAGVTDKAMVSRLSGVSFDNFKLAGLLTAIKEASASDSALNTAAISELNKLSLSAAAIRLLSNVTNYPVVIQSVQNAASVNDYLEKLLEKEVLYEIENCANVRDPKAFIAEINNAKYNNATEAQKNYICEQISNKPYLSITAVHNAINSLSLPSDPSGGFSGGGGSTSSPRTGTIGGDYMNAPVKPSENLFSDVAPDHWAQGYIEKMYAWNIMSGFEGNFRPNDRITRAELLKTLVEAYGVTGNEACDFSDVNPSEWYAKYIGIAFNNGLVTGFDGEFHPNDFVTRQDAIVMIHRFGKNAGLTFASDELNYIDASDISDYAVSAVSEVSGTKIIGGYEDNTIKPLGSLTRAETTKIIYNSLTIGGLRND